MRKQVFFAITTMAILSFVGGCQKPVADSPELTLETNEFVVAAAGGSVSVPFELTNASEGSVVTVEPSDEYDWVKVTSVGDTSIELSVAKNETEFQREAEFTVSYPGVSADIKFSVFQAAGEPVPAYDYEYVTTLCSGEYYGAFGNDGEINYFVVLSTLPYDEEGYAQVGGAYYIFDMYASPDAGRDIPAGTYTVGEAGETKAMTFSPDYSRFVVMGEDEASTFGAYFVEGTMTVAVDGDTYSFEAFLTDEDGSTHHVTYTGPAEIPDPAPDPDPEPDPTPVITDPLEVEATFGQALYVTDESDVMCVNMQFTDMPVQGTSIIPPGTLLNVEVYMPNSDDGKIATGTYNVVDDIFNNLTVGSGYDIFGYPGGTYVEHYYDGSNYSLGYVTSGTMEISEGSAEGEYSVVCDFVTAEGVSVKCSWSGEMEVLGLPGPESTLESDYTVDLTGTHGVGYYYGDYYGTGGNWMVSLEPDGAGDGLQLELVMESLDFAEGIPTGTYTAPAGSIPGAGEYALGYMSGGNYLTGTWYMYFDEGGNIVGYAPAKSGDFDVVNHGDGTYTFSFSHYDGLGHTWSGEWTGAIDMRDLTSSSFSVSSADTGRAMHSAMSGSRAAKTAEQKAALIRENGLHVNPSAASSADFVGAKKVLAK